jgi:chemotaxis protein CheX
MRKVCAVDRTVRKLYSSEINHVVENVFATMMGVEVFQSEVEFPEAAGLLTGAVYLAGQWEGAVLLQCSPRQACVFTGRFLSSEPPESVNEEVRDVVAELTNVIAGNLKSGPFKSSHMSLPSVVEGDTYCLSVRGRNLMKDRRAFSFLGGPFWLTLIELWE